MEHFIKFWNQEHPELPVTLWDDVTGPEYVLGAGTIREIIARQRRAAICWVGPDGAPDGSIIPFAAVGDAPEVFLLLLPALSLCASLQADPRIAMCWYDPAGAVTIRGRLERLADAEKPALAARIAAQRYPNDAERQPRLAAKLAAPASLAARLVEEKRITFSFSGIRTEAWEEDSLTIPSTTHSAS